MDKKLEDRLGKMIRNSIRSAKRSNRWPLSSEDFDEKGNIRYDAHGNIIYRHPPGKDER